MNIQFKKFCEAMADAMNIEAMKHANGLISWERVAQMPEAWAAFTLQVNMSQVASS